jgi:superfamily II DNA/RNA helicase
VARVAEELEERGFAAAAIHGDLGQGAREQALRAFRNGKVDVLVATDVAARGIDVDDVTHVINYQCPEDEKTYLHRIGRTARAGNKGTAITFVDWDEVTRWNMISSMLDLGMPDPPETYSSSDHLFGDLDIPEGTRGMLPRAARTRAGLDAETVEDLGETGGRNRSGRGAAGGGSDRGGRGGGRGSERSGERGGRGERSGHTGRGERDHGRDDTEIADGEAAEPVEGGERRPRRPRQRRRTRGGQPIDVAEGTEGAPTPATNGTAVAATVDSLFDDGSISDQDGVEDGDTTDGGAPRRRRRRRSSARTSASATASASAPTGTDSPSE